MQFPYEGIIQHLNCCTKVTVIYADDDVQLIRALIDHTNIDACLAQGSKDLTGNTGTERHFPADSCHNSDLVMDIQGIRLHFLLQFAQNRIDAGGNRLRGNHYGHIVNAVRHIVNRNIMSFQDFTIIALTKRGMSGQVGVLRKVLTVLERHNISVDYVPNGIDNVSVVVPTEAVASSIYTILGELQKEVEPDTLNVHDQIAVVAAVGRKMAFRPGISGKIFATLGEAGINIRMINQGPDELNIIVGVDNRDFGAAIKVLYDSFVRKLQ